ncbi:hypothetical protein MMR14E_10820 [Methylobacterium mesophilicum]
MRSITMRLFMLVAAVLALPAPASALCRCTCVRGEMRAICQETDLTVPICQGICETTIRPERVIVPLAGGRQAFEPAQSTNPSPGGLATQDPNLDTNPNGTVLGTPSQLSGSVGSSLSSGSGR